MLAEDCVHTDETEVTFVEITLQCPCALLIASRLLFDLSRPSSSRTTASGASPACIRFSDISALIPCFDVMRFTHSGEGLPPA